MKNIDEVVEELIEEVENRLYGMNIEITQKEYNRVFDELKVTLPKPFKQALQTVEREMREEAVNYTIAYFLRMNLEDPKAPVNVDEVKRRVLEHFNPKHHE